MLKLFKYNAAYISFSKWQIVFLLANTTVNTYTSQISDAKYSSMNGKCNLYVLVYSTKHEVIKSILITSESKPWNIHKNILSLKSEEKKNFQPGPKKKFLCIKRRV